jgi:predicted RNA-binding Zn-ribbon protein involved in translation (DUF1610 family)
MRFAALMYCQLWRLAFPRRARRAGQRWRAKHTVERGEYIRRWTAANRTRVAKLQADYFQRHKISRRKYMRELEEILARGRDAILTELDAPAGAKQPSSSPSRVSPPVAGTTGRPSNPGRWAEPEPCPKCGSTETERLHHAATFALPECWFWQCEKCGHQWGQT